MVGSTQRILRTGGLHGETQCIPISDALEATEHHGLLADGFNLQILRAIRSGEVDEATINNSNVRVDKQNVTVEQRGCVSEDILTTTRLVAVDCAEQATERCDGCVMNLGQIGESLHKALKARNEPINVHTDCF